MRFWLIAFLVLAVLSIWATLPGHVMPAAAPALQAATPTFRPTRTPVPRSPSPTVTDTRPLTPTATVTFTITPTAPALTPVRPPITATVELSPSITITATPSPTAPAATLWEGRIAVIGEATVPTAPDRLEVEIALEASGTTPGEAFEESQALAENVFAALVRAGVPRNSVRRVGYEVFTRAAEGGEQGVRRPSPQRRFTTIVVLRLRFTVTDEERAGEVLAAATGAGATRVLAIEPALSEERRRQAERRARRLALDQARAKALEIAALSGMELGGTVAIEERTPVEEFPVSAEELSVVLHVVFAARPAP